MLVLREKCGEKSVSGVWAVPGAASVWRRSLASSGI